MKHQLSSSAHYWREHSISWESSAYFKEKESIARPWDRLSTFFRGDAMYRRMSRALSILTPFIKQKIILDAGCGSGLFSKQLVAAGAKKVYGIDASQESINLAIQKAYSSKDKEKCIFKVDDLINPHSPYPKVDIVISLGLIEYFDRKDLSQFLHNLKTQYIFFDFPHPDRKKQFPTWVLRQLYTKVHGLPGIYHYTPQEFKDLTKPLGIHNLRLIAIDTFFFMTNIPLKHI